METNESKNQIQCNTCPCAFIKDFSANDFCCEKYLEALRRCDIEVVGHSCGYGKGPGFIDLADGITMILARTKEERDLLLGTKTVVYCALDPNIRRKEE